jgi:hypothetical protein
LVVGGRRVRIVRSSVADNTEGAQQILITVGIGTGTGGPET